MTRPVAMPTPELQRLLVGLIMADPDRVAKADQSLWKRVPVVAEVWPFHQLSRSRFASLRWQTRWFCFFLV